VLPWISGLILDVLLDKSMAEEEKKGIALISLG
jgi:hypothetical protein